MDKPTFGVLITYYGERELLRECLDGLARQSCAPDEILVYDDASDAPADAYVPDGVPVRILRGQVNRGPAHGRNQLLEASTSTYIHFHDADDLFSPKWLGRVRETVEATQADVVFTEIDVADEHGLRSSRVLGLDQLAQGADLVQFCVRGVMLVPSGTYRRQRIVDMGGYRTALWQAEDFDFHVRLAATAPRYAVIADPLVTIRVRAGGRSRDQVQTWSSYVQAVASLSEELPARYRADLSDAAARAGSVLYKLGAHDRASAAFRLAARLGPPRLTTQRGMYRLLARTLGFEAAERFGLAYRRVLPARLRAQIGAR